MAAGTHIRIPQLPTVLTTSRIVFSAVLLFTRAFSLVFFLVYVWCGLSDILDGILARKLKKTSNFGAILDSVADIVFSVVLLIVLIRDLIWHVWMYLFVTLVVLLRLSTVLIGCLKFHAFVSLHTYANKAAGVSLFALPLLYLALGLPLATGTVGVVFSLAAIDELIILLRMKKLDRNIRGFFEQKKAISG